MPKAVIIGCGRLGRRHLEALGALETPLNIWGIDPFDKALSLASENFVLANKNSHHILSLVTSFDELPAMADVVISATDSVSRLSSLRNLFERVEVKNLLLEKVLFSRLSDFDIAERLFKDRCKDVWVNCPRRANTTYAEIKNYICSANNVNMEVRGGSWGLASNSIHFIDLYAFLTGQSLKDVDISKLERVLHQSKREGFVELSGRIDCTFACGHLSLNSDINGPLEVEIEIQADDLVININELEGTVKVLSDNHAGFSREKIELLPQSRLTTSYVFQLLSGEKLPLPSYDESAALHKPFLDACARHQALVLGKEVVNCKIT